MAISIALAAYNKKIATEITAKLARTAEDEGRGLRSNVAFNNQQQALFTWVRAGSGSAFLRARAGTGKTTTLIGAVRAMLGNSLADIRGVRSGTFHSFGYSAVRRVLPDARLDAKLKAERVLAEARVAEPLHSFVTRLVSLAKQSALGLFGSVDDDRRWWDLVERHDLAYDLEDPELAAQGVEVARRALRLSNDISRELIDFDDMIYLPVVRNYRVWQNDWVGVDEAQDTNAARRALARKMLKPGGRAVFLGDDRQAIYGFTGADADAIDIITREFGCTTLPLTVTYRCPKAVVAMARALVPDIEAHETAPQGEVGELHERDLLREELVASDAILCRKTAPLVSQAYRLIKAGVACHVEGREIGQGLLKLAKRWKVRTTEALRNKLEDYREREVAKFMSKGQETKAEALNDRVDTLLVLMEGCADLDCVERKISEMFADDAPTLTLSTIHKAKGREWPRVYILGHHQFMPSPFARQAWQQVQEENLEYVAITRSQGVLKSVAVDVNRPPA